MPKDKTQVTVEIEQDQWKWLEAMAKKFSLPDESKALRVLLDMAMMRDDQSDIFDRVRCLRCD